MSRPSESTIEEGRHIWRETSDTVGVEPISLMISWEA
jgi:hypothetical protein